MTLALSTPPLMVALVLGLLIGLCLSSLVVTIVNKTVRDRRERRDAAIRADLADLPEAVVLRPTPPPAPTARDVRTVARDLVIDTSFHLEGHARDRAIAWFEASGFVDEDIARLQNRGRVGSRRLRAAVRLGRMGSPRAGVALAQGLRSTSSRLREACAVALGRVAQPEYVADLVDALARREIPRGVLSNALLHLPDEADDALIAQLSHPDAGVRAIICEVLALRRTEAAVDPLLHLLADPQPWVRRSAVLALSGISERTHLDIDSAPLLALCRDESSIVRSGAATSMGPILGDGAAEVLAELCYDEDYWVSHRAAESLCRLPSGEQFGWDVIASNDQSPRAHQAKAACLEWMERTGGIERRLDGQLQRGDDAGLMVSLAVLEGVGSVAWGDIFGRAPLGVGLPMPATTAVQA